MSSLVGVGVKHLPTVYCGNIRKENSPECDVVSVTEIKSFDNRVPNAIKAF